MTEALSQILNHASPESEEAHVDDLLRELQTRWVQTSADIGRMTTEREQLLKEQTHLKAKDETRETELIRVTTLLVEAKDDADTQKQRVDRYKQKLEENQKIVTERDATITELKAGLVQKDATISSRDRLIQDRVKEIQELKKAQIDQTAHSQQRDQDLASLKAQVETLKTRCLDLEAALASAQQINNHTEPDNPAEPNMPEGTGQMDDGDDRGVLVSQVEKQKKQIRSLKARIATLEEVFQAPNGVSAKSGDNSAVSHKGGISSGNSPRQEYGALKALNEELDLLTAEEVKQRCLELASKSMKLEESLKAAFKKVSKVQSEVENKIETLINEKDLIIERLKQEAEASEERFIRETSDLNRQLEKAKQDFEVRLKDKELEVFYVMRQQEAVTIQKNDEIEHLKKIATTENSKEHLPSLPGSPAGESLRLENDNLKGEISVLKTKNARLSAEMEELRKKAKRSLQQLDMLAVDRPVLPQGSGEGDSSQRGPEVVPAQHVVYQGSGPLLRQTPKPTRDKTPIDAETQENRHRQDEVFIQQLQELIKKLEEEKKALETENEKAKEIHKQYMHDYEYVRTDSDYRITNEDFEAMKSDKRSDDKGALQQIAALMRDRLGVQKEITPENIVSLLGKELLRLPGQNEPEMVMVAPKHGQPKPVNNQERIDELTIDNQQLKKQVDSLTTQNGHLKEKILKQTDPHSPADSSLQQSLQAANTEIGRLYEEISKFLVDMEQRELGERKGPQRVKELLYTVSKGRKRMLADLKARDELIDELKLTSHKGSSDKGEVSPAAAQSEEFSKLKESLIKYHNMRRKYEEAVAEKDRLSAELEHSRFEVEDLQNSLQLEKKKLENLQIQIDLLKEQHEDTSGDVKEHIKKLFSELFKVFTDTKDPNQANHLMDYLTSMLGFTQEEKKTLTDSIKKSKMFDKILKKK